MLDACEDLQNIAIIGITTVKDRRKDIKDKDETAENSKNFKGLKC